MKYRGPQRRNIEAEEARIDVRELSSDSNEGKSGSSPTALWKIRKYITTKTVLKFILTAICIALFISIMYVAWKLLTKESRICKTVECVRISSEILQKLDLTVHPCEDFYQYSCGKWLRNTIISPSESYLRDNSQNQIYKKLIANMQSWKHLSRRSAKRRVYNFYVSCINESIEMDKNAEKSLFDLVGDLGNSSFLGAADASILDFRLTLKTVLTKYLLKSFVEINIDTNIVFILANGPVLGARQKFLSIAGNANITNRTIYNFYKEFIKKTFIILGSPLTSYEIDTKVDDIVTLETKMNVLNNSSEPETFNLSSLSDAFKTFDFNDIITSLMTSVNVSIDDIVHIAVEDPSYFRYLDDMFRSENPDTLRNYVIWIGIYETFKFASNELRRYHNHFEKLLYSGPRVVHPRWFECIRTLNRYKPLADVVSVEYLKNSELDTPLIEDILKRIKDAFRSNVNSVSWLDAESKKAVAQKFENLIVSTKPQRLENETRVEKNMENIEMDQYSYFRNKIILLKVERVESYQTDVKTQLIVPYDINALYVFHQNRADFNRAAFIKPDYTNMFYSQLLGSIGVIIGHEFTHMIESMGIQSVVSTSGDFSNSSRDKFIEISSCMIEQFNSYHLYGMSLLGAKEFNENMADNGGLSVAFTAFNKWKSENDDKQEYPGLDLTADQLFFVSFAHNNCEKYSRDYGIQNILNNNHAPGKFRVIGSVSNNKDFSKAFNCKLGSKMNRVKKCFLI